MGRTYSIHEIDDTFMHSAVKYGGTEAHTRHVFICVYNIKNNNISVILEKLGVGVSTELYCPSIGVIVRLLRTR
jgi:hypothetical protein